MLATIARSSGDRPVASAEGAFDQFAQAADVRVHFHGAFGRRRFRQRRQRRQDDVVIPADVREPHARQTFDSTWMPFCVRAIWRMTPAVPMCFMRSGFGVSSSSVLKGEDDHPVGRERAIDAGDGHRMRHDQRRDGHREDHRIAERDDGQLGRQRAIGREAGATGSAIALSV